MPLVRGRVVLVIVAAFVVATLGVARLVASTATPATVSIQTTVDNLRTRVVTAGWTTMDHDMSGDATGYQMPPAMMPGMPDDGDQRLAVAVAVVNTGEDTRPLRAGKEFALHAGAEGRRWTPHSSTFGALPRLAPHNTVEGTLFFDLPPAELTASPAWIEWTHADTVNRLAIPMDGVSAGPSHSHNH
jgi:hypothetical protein